MRASGERATKGRCVSGAYLELLLIQPVENVACAVPNFGVCQSAFDCFLSEVVVQGV